MPNSPIAVPAGYATVNAIAFSDGDGNAAQVSNTAPLPVQVKPASGGSLAGSSALSGVFGPFVPALDRPAVLTLSGTWTGTVKVTRSTDGGATRTPLTIAGDAWAQFTVNCCEPVWEESEASAALYLDVTLASGTLAYRLGQ
ncbi:hypothetical protein OLX02_10575 [Novosphingobium sp. KCTC 2891]|uniref:hypothetical protein n=1 Tax=Novosphingobium sp. KCTC 2891 TaxID=2989730 RepID=UPI002223BACB|nr:hypothetical protein [Novosphingobium sp. KCTC 2891]MCW1383267.1 hypothetical protein [Novosphingobium sp. KCTC 2891]